MTGSDRATDTALLQERININRAYSSGDFDSWLFERLAVQLGEDILDVGCGTGNQTLQFTRLVGPGGSVSALDLSAESIEQVKQRAGVGARLQVVAADMDDLQKIITETFAVMRYDLVHSSYALYYAKRPTIVLDAMRGAMKPAGRCAIFVPNAPHGLVNLAAKFASVPAEVTDSLDFGPKVLAPYFEKNFKSVTVQHFNNVVKLPDAETLLKFYRQTTYYDAKAEDGMRAVAEEAIRREGHFRYQKNGYMIIGRNGG